MKNDSGKSPNKRKVLYAGLGLLLIALLCLGYGISAKFIRQRSLSSKLTINSDFTADIGAKGHKAKKNADGTYRIGTKEVGSNRYSVLPGTDIPADLYVKLSEKSSVSSYLYIEVVDETASGVDFKLAKNWTLLSDTVGPHGGAVYCYAKQLNAKSSAKIGVLRDDKYFISEEFDSDEASSLTVYPFIARAEDKTPEEAFDPSSFGSAYTAEFAPYPSGGAKAEAEGGAADSLAGARVKAGENGYSVYVRVRVTVEWCSDAGKALAEPPQENTDYTVEYNSQWLKREDGFWYWPKPLLDGESTPALIDSFEKLSKAPEGYDWKVDIVVEAIQAPGSTDADDTPIITSIWGCAVNSKGNIKK